MLCKHFSISLLNDFYNEILELNGIHIILDQWFLAFLMLQLFNEIPHVVVIP